MTTTIYLTRHGQTEWNLEKRLQGRGDSPLTSAGIERAKELANHIETLSIDAIYSSPIKRAYETACILRGERPLMIYAEDDLSEMNFGDYEGQRIEDLKQIDPYWDITKVMAGDEVMCAPKGENLAEVRARIKKVMDEILVDQKGRTILLVAHGITLKALMHYFGDLEAEKEVMGQATLTKIEITDKETPKIIFKNDDTHFTIKDKQLGW